MKISYMAFEQGVTIYELFYNAILKTYNKLIEEEYIIEN